MKSLIPRFREHFDPLRHQLECFAKQGVQLEGWFKGELLFALHRLKVAGVVSNFDREVRIGQKKVDLRIDIAGRTNWIELKYWLVGEQRGTTYGPRFYFGDRAVGIAREVKALQDLPAAGNRWILIMTAARPDPVAWKDGLILHNEKFSNSLRAHTDPKSFPEFYFLGLLEVEA